LAQFRTIDATARIADNRGEVVNTFTVLRQENDELEIRESNASPERREFCMAPVRCPVHEIASRANELEN
jgi:hypothetical protein